MGESDRNRKEEIIKKVGPEGQVMGLDMTHAMDDYLAKLKAAGFADVQVVTSDEWQPLMLRMKIKAVKVP